MKRTTIYLEPELELALKSEMLRRRKPMAELIREALRGLPWARAGYAATGPRRLQKRPPRHRGQGRGDPREDPFRRGRVVAVLLEQLL